MNWTTKRPLDFFTLTREADPEWEKLPPLLRAFATLMLFAMCMTVVVVTSLFELAQFSPLDLQRAIRRMR